MAATEKMVGCLQQSSSSMGSSAILSFKPLHPHYEFGRSHRKLTPSLQASTSINEERTTRKLHEECRSRSSSVSSLLKAVQEGGSTAVVQQVSSIRHFFTPELPQAIIAEIKKRMGLSLKDQDDEENAIRGDLNGDLIEESHEKQVTLLGPRCAWPRLKFARVEEEWQEEVAEGPRCAWPRVAQMQSCSSRKEQWKQEEKISSTRGEGASGARPRGTSRSYYQNNTLEGLQKGALLQESLEKEALSKSVQEGKEGTMGPRCAWPRSTPRRMLATGVGLSLINYLLIGQGVPALAILLDHPLPMICEEEPSLSNPLQSLLP